MGGGKIVYDDTYFPAWDVTEKVKDSMNGTSDYDLTGLVVVRSLKESLTFKIFEIEGQPDRLEILGLNADNPRYYKKDEWDAIGILIYGRNMIESMGTPYLPDSICCLCIKQVIDGIQGSNTPQYLYPSNRTAWGQRFNTQYACEYPGINNVNVFVDRNESVRNYSFPKTNTTLGKTAIESATWVYNQNASSGYPGYIATNIPEYVYNNKEVDKYDTFMGCVTHITNTALQIAPTTFEIQYKGVFINSPCLSTSDPHTYFKVYSSETPTFYDSSTGIIQSNWLHNGEYGNIFFMAERQCLMEDWGFSTADYNVCQVFWPTITDLQILYARLSVIDNVLLKLIELGFQEYTLQEIITAMCNTNYSGLGGYFVSSTTYNDTHYLAIQGLSGRVILQQVTGTVPTNVWPFTIPFMYCNLSMFNL